MKSHEASHRGKVLILLPSGHARSRSDHPLPPRIRAEGASAPARGNRPARALLWPGQGRGHQMGGPESKSGCPGDSGRAGWKPRRRVEYGRCRRSGGRGGTGECPNRNVMAPSCILRSASGDGDQQHATGQFQTRSSCASSSSRMFGRRHGITGLRPGGTATRVDVRNASRHQRRSG